MLHTAVLLPRLSTATVGKYVSRVVPDSLTDGTHVGAAAAGTARPASTIATMTVVEALRPSVVAPMAAPPETRKPQKPSRVKVQLSGEFESCQTQVAHSHSMVPGGLDVMSSVTRLTSRTSLVIRVEMRSRRS